MMRHERRKDIQQDYVMDELGAPFKVILSNGVTFSTDPKTGKELVTVVDVVGLIGAVVRARIQHPRKLSGKEVKFIRDALSVRAKAVAAYLDITPEHLSRCENGSKVMSASHEKMFRLKAFVTTYGEQGGKLFVRLTNEELETASRDFLDAKEDVKEMAWEFLNAFLSMKIESVYAADEKPLEFVFRRNTADKTKEGSKPDDDGKWDTAIEKAA